MRRVWTLAGLVATLATAPIISGCRSDSQGVEPTDLKDTGDQDMAGPDVPDDSDGPGTDSAQDLGADLPDVPQGTPILDRTPDLQFTCEVTRDTTNHKPLKWNIAAHSLVTTSGGKVFLSRMEASPPSPFEYAPAFLRVSTFESDGTMGTSVEIDAKEDSMSGIGSASVGDGFLVAWADGKVNTSLRDADGAPVGSVQLVEATATDYVTRPMLAPLGDQVGLVMSLPAGSGHKIRFLRLNAQGAKTGEAVDFVSAGDDWNNPAPSLAAGQDRWGIVWQENKQAKGAIYFAVVNAQGQIVVPKKRVSSVDEAGVETAPGGFSQPKMAVLASGSGWIIAWSEVRNGIDYSSGASAIIKLARLDAEGNSVEEAPVRELVVDVDEVEPLLLPFQGALGLFWSTGTHIYMCGGCWPNHKVHFVLLDPATWTPVSEVLTLTPTPNGLLDLTAAAIQDEILVTAQIGYHVYQDPASAALKCTLK